MEGLSSLCIGLPACVHTIPKLSNVHVCAFITMAVQCTMFVRVLLRVLQLLPFVCLVWIDYYYVNLVCAYDLSFLCLAYLVCALFFLFVPRFPCVCLVFLVCALFFLCVPCFPCVCLVFLVCVLFSLFVPRFPCLCLVFLVCASFILCLPGLLCLRHVYNIFLVHLFCALFTSFCLFVPSKSVCVWATLFVPLLTLFVPKLPCLQPLLPGLSPSCPVCADG